MYMPLQLTADTLAEGVADLARRDPHLAADLACFTLARFDAGAYRLCRDAFLAHYNAEPEHLVGAEDLRLHTVLALCERLEPVRLGRNGSNGDFVSALDFALREDEGDDLSRRKYW